MLLSTVVRHLGNTRPRGLKWRSSIWFSTLVVGLGVSTDLLIYSIPVPVLPFQLQALGYDNVSSRVGWLLFAFSAGTIIATPFIASYSERYQARKWPLVFGLVALVGSQILFMEASAYWVMCIARILQGMCSAVVYTIGLSLLCDITPEHRLGRQLGLTMSALTLGMLVGPPISGALYGRFGARAPYLFGIITTVADLICRLLLVDRKEALRWGVDTRAEETARAAEFTADAEVELASVHSSRHSITPSQHDGTTGVSSSVSVVVRTEVRMPEATGSPEASTSSGAPLQNVSTKHSNTQPEAQMSEFKVVAALCHSPRALSAMSTILIYAIALGAQEPTMPLHLEEIWDLNSSKIGLVLISAVIPSIFSSPLVGWWSDRYGPEWLVFGGILLTLPWWGILTIHGSLSIFVVAYAFDSLFSSAFITPIMSELAAVARGMEGIGYAHVYGAFNLAYGVGTGLGPIIGGQLYDHTKLGWVAVCVTALSLLFVPLVLAFFFCGPLPLAVRVHDLVARRKQRAVTENEADLGNIPITAPVH